MNKKISLLFICILILPLILAGSLEDDKIPVVIQPKNSELIATTLTEEQIKEIEQLSVIENIELVPSFSAFLQDSSPLVNASVTHTLLQDSINLTGIDETVCVIDTGIDFTHSDLSTKNFTCVINCYNQECVEDCSVGDNNGHGTHVAGIIASPAGIAKGAKLIGLKVLDENGNSHPTTGTLDIMNAIEWCTINREAYNISVISMSLGTSTVFIESCDSSFSSTLTPAINNATLHNITVVSATGNSGPGIPRNTTAIGGPACIVNSTAVSATNKDDSIASYGHYNNLTDFFAPGTNINSTLAGGGYTLSSGTSMSTPHVSAAFTIIKQFKRLQDNLIFTPGQISSALKTNGKNISVPAGFNISRIDIYNTIISLDTLAPSTSLVSPSNNQVSPIKNQTFECNATDLQLTNMTFYLWNSTSGVVNQTTESITSSSHTFNYNITNISEGTYQWNCLYEDENTNQAFASSNFTFQIGGILTTLSSPGDDLFTNNASTNFTCASNSEESYALTNSTFNLWNSTALIHEETKNISGLSNSSTFNFTFSIETNYSWNCLSTNNNSNTSFASSNHTITFDTTEPNVTLISPADSYSASGTTTVLFEYNVTDNLNITQCDLILNDESVAQNSSEILNPNNISYSVVAGSYSWQINCADQASNIGNSSSRTLTINTPAVTTSSSSGGGGGGGSPTQTYTPTDDQLSTGYARELKKSDKVKLTIFDKESQAHTLTMNEITSNSVNITIRSDPINFKLGIGQSIRLNLTSGEFYDLYIRLDSIKNNKAQLTIQTIFEMIPESTQEEIPEPTINNESDTTQQEQKEEQETSPENSNLLIITLGVIIVALLLLLVRYLKSRRQMKKEITKEVKEDLKEKNSKKK